MQEIEELEVEEIKEVPEPEPVFSREQIVQLSAIDSIAVDRVGEVITSIVIRTRGGYTVPIWGAVCQEAFYRKLEGFISGFEPNRWFSGEASRTFYWPEMSVTVGTEGEEHG